MSDLEHIDEIDSILSDVESIESDTNIYSQLDSSLENVVEIAKVYTGEETNTAKTTVDNINNKISVDVKPFKWMDCHEDEWTNENGFYSYTIPFSVHKMANAYIAEFMLRDGDNLECVLKPTYKLLANDDIYIRGDKPIDFKILIKGDR